MDHSIGLYFNNRSDLISDLKSDFTYLLSFCICRFKIVLPTWIALDILPNYITNGYVLTNVPNLDLLS